MCMLCNSSLCINFAALKEYIFIKTNYSYIIFIYKPKIE